MIKKQAEIYLDHLDVREHLYLTIGITTKMPEKLEGITLPLPSPEPAMYQMLKVLIQANLSKEKQLLVLAHEMIHVKQYAKNELITMHDKRVVWKGKKHYYSQADNLNKPWEKEAYRNDHILAQIDEPSQNPKQETLAEQIPNRISNSTTYKCSYVIEKCKEQKTSS
ncbi:hypothetical protein OKW21_005233 [Catalinimonas alkaloidigena]|uniref:hypothetical protein n=1 Tax=Catalinimonas alkaloidigena TaxID=1075417 RepID=UPI00240664F8|nr:hypothetical protein [Catalinimonas alkaloidigena]MDF9799970.1 hypothetical protein [Catalinimonas alkaloidigena]